MEINYSNSKFCFVIPSFNNEKNITKNLTSLITQVNKNWRCIYVNDCSTDNTESLFFDTVRRYDVESKFTYILNKEHSGQLYSKYTAYKLVDDFEIVCILDGDDWLSDANVLTRLTIVYSDQNVQMVSSNFNYWEDGHITMNNLKQYPQDVIVNKNFRQYKGWRVCHLKSGYGIFFKSIPKEYLRLNDKWLPVCTDVAEYYSALELSKGKYISLDDIMYIYNKTNSLLYDTSFYREESRETHKICLEYVRSLPHCKYSLPKAYIINMAKSFKRRECMELQMSFQSNTNFKFIEGIDGSTDLETAALMKKYFKYMNIQNDSQDVPFSSSTMIDSLKNKYNFKRQHITKGSLGLIQSIFLLLNDFVKGDEDHALIFEDDIYTLKDLDNNLFINKELLKGKDLVYLGCHTGRHDIYPEKSNSIFIDVLNHTDLIYGGYSIIISKQLAQHILDIGVNTILRLNLSWDLILNYIRDTQKYPFTFFIYFTQLFIPNIIKRGGINTPRDLTFYTENKMIVSKYYIPGVSNETNAGSIRGIMLMHNEESLFNFVSKVVYINLDNRVDRKQHVENQLSSYIHTDKIRRFNAIRHEKGAIGCGLSQIAILEMAIAENWDNVFIAEDDLTWTDQFIEGYAILEKLIEKDYDVIVLGGTFIKSYKNTFKLISCNCALSYIVNKSYYQTLLKCFKDAVQGLIESYDKPIYAIDQAWKTLQNRDNWYIIKPNMCMQLPSYSDIENEFKDYTNYFKTMSLEYDYQPHLQFSELHYENDDRFNDNKNTNWYNSKHLVDKHFSPRVNNNSIENNWYTEAVVNHIRSNANKPINYSMSSRKVGFFTKNTTHMSKTK